MASRNCEEGAVVPGTIPAAASDPCMSTHKCDMAKNVSGSNRDTVALYTKRNVECESCSVTGHNARWGFAAPDVSVAAG